MGLRHFICTHRCAVCVWVFVVFYSFCLWTGSFPLLPVWSLVHKTNLPSRIAVGLTDFLSNKQKNQTKRATISIHRPERTRFSVNYYSYYPIAVVTTYYCRGPPTVSHSNFFVFFFHHHYISFPVHVISGWRLKAIRANCNNYYSNIALLYNTV